MSEREDQLVPLDTAKQTPSTRGTAQEIMDRRMFNPIEKLIDLAVKLEGIDDSLDIPVFVDKRLTIYNNLAKFMYAQPKAVDINVTSKQSFTIEAVSFANLIDSRKEMFPTAIPYGGPSVAGAIETEAEEIKDA